MNQPTPVGLPPVTLGAALAPPVAAALPVIQFPIQPVIMAGGAGTRLWPLSREQFPKQLLNLVAEDTLLEATARRFEGVAVLAGRPAGIEPPQLVVCGEEHRFMIADMMKRAGKPARLLTEPCGRNTAPALTVAALHAVAATGDGARGAMWVMWCWW